MDAAQLKTFNFNNLVDPHDLDIQQEWLVQDIIPAQSLTMIAGASGSGKSTVTLLLAHSVARGVPFLGHETKQTPVLIVDRENGAAIYKERFERLNIEKHENIRYWGSWDEFPPEGPAFEGFIEAAKAVKPLVIFDSFIAFLEEGSEQDATDIRKYTRLYRALVNAGATVIFIHHTGKGENTKDYRGSSGIKDDVDMAWVLRSTEYMRTAKLHKTKCREGLAGDIAFSLEGSGLILVETAYVPDTDPDWDAVHKAVRDYPDMNQSELAKRLPNVPATKVRKILLAAGQKGTLLEVTGNAHNAKVYRAVTFNGENKAGPSKGR